jgi:plastocyanin
VADLVEVSDLNTGFTGVREMRAFAIAKGADDTPFEFEPATQTVSGQVTVRFRLKTFSL